MYHTAGLTKDEIIDLCAMVQSAGLEPGVNHWPPSLELVYVHGYRVDISSPQSGSGRIGGDVR
ncbi:MAG: hypothetical protein ACRDRW_13365, partial [Pseudonocardiaceae bacterium]